MRNLYPADNSLEQIESLSLDDRAAFYTNNKDKFSDDLKAQISNVVTQSKQSSLNVNFVGNGEFLDEMDLKDKYEKKPGVAAKIMERTKTFMCPNTDRMMYEDMTYKSDACWASKRTHYEASSIEQESVRKAAKKSKKARVVKVASEGPEKPFTPNQKKGVDKAFADYEKLITKMTEAENGIATESLGPFMPAHLLTKHSAVLAQVKLDAAELGVSIEAGNGNYGAIRDTLAAAKKSCKDIANRIDPAVDEAAAAKLEV